jgi:hypothetical protein
MLNTADAIKLCRFRTTKHYLSIETVRCRNVDRGDCMDLQLPVQSVQSVPITTRVASSNSSQGEVSSIQHYVMNLVSDLRQVRGFLSIHYFVNC